jgi:hypothetical protein
MEALATASFITWQQGMFYKVEALRAHGVRIDVACELVAEREGYDPVAVAIAHFIEAANRMLPLTVDVRSSSVRPSDKSAAVGERRSPYREEQSHAEHERAKP